MYEVKVSTGADFVNEYIKPLGSIFLSLLKFIVVPLVLFSIMAGILSMNDVSKVGRLGLQEEWPCRAMYLDSACEKMIRRTFPVTHNWS